MSDDLVDRLREEWQRLSGHSLDHGSADAGIAANLADEAANEIERLERVVAARDRRIARLMLAFEDARRQGLVLPGDLDPPVVLSGKALTP